MKINNSQCKSIIGKSKLPEADYCINPYIGCMHRCVYCYARFMRRFTGHTEKWGDFLDIKINAPEILEKQLSRGLKRGEVFLGSTTDVYQPIERKYELTRKILEILVKYNFPISILTKSDLVVRDIDLIKKFKERNVGLTITTLDEKIARDFEPGTSMPQQRLDALRKLHDAGIETYAFIGPVLPYITDLRAIFSKIKKIVDYVMVETLNLKCGNEKDIQRVLKNKYPQLVSLYKTHLNRTYWDKVEKEVRELSSEFKIPLKGFYRH